MTSGDLTKIKANHPRRSVEEKKLCRPVLQERYQTHVSFSRVEGDRGSNQGNEVGIDHIREGMEVI